MPQHSQTITVAGLDAEALQQIAFNAFQQLGWKVALASEKILVAYTPRSWKRYDNEVTIECGPEILTVTSKMIHGEIMDAMGRTKKDVAGFLAAFEQARAAWTGPEEKTAEEIVALTRQTEQQIVQEVKQAQEIDAAMNLSKSNLWVTYAIMAANIIVFVLMAIDGAGIFDANGLVHLKWGSNYGPLTQTGDWWRLLTNIFLHFGIIHLAMNMYALYMVGVYLEPMLGKLRFITAYLGCGILASVASLWWHSEGANSAGASGAIFGLYGLFLALLTTKLIPEIVRNTLLQTTAIFVAYNLFYGMKGGVDNAAHIGGLVSGFLAGQLYILTLKKEKREEKKIHWAGPLVLTLSAAGAFLYLQQNPRSRTDRESVVYEMNNAGSPDYERFNSQLQQFDEWHAKAQTLFQDSTMDDAAIKAKIENEIRGYWAKARLAIEATSSMRVPDNLHRKADKLLDYISLRDKELDILLQMIANGDSEVLLPQLNQNRARAEEVFQEAIKM